MDFDPTAPPAPPDPHRKRYIQYGFGSGKGKSIAVPERVYQFLKRHADAAKKKAQEKYGKPT